MLFRARSWVGVNTRLGPVANRFFAQYRRQVALQAMARRRIDAGARVVVFPESIVGSWTPAVAYWWRPVDARARRSGVSLLLGTQYPRRAGWDAGFAERGARNAALLSRQPIPIKGACDDHRSHTDQQGPNDDP